MKDFFQAVAQWQVFYTTVASASATLSGLLFVSLSLNIDLLRQPQNRNSLRKAQLSFSNFLYVLMFSLMFLIPIQSPRGLGMPLLIMGLFGLVGLAGMIWRALQPDPEPEDWKRLARDTWLSVVGYTALVYISIRILNRDAEVLGWLVAVMIVLVVGAARNAWDLLVDVKKS